MDIAAVVQMTPDTTNITTAEDNKEEETTGRIEIEDSSMMEPDETIGGLVVATP